VNTVVSCTKEDGLIKVVTTSTNICLPVLDLSLALDIALGYACIIALVITTAIVITLVDDNSSTDRCQLNLPHSTKN